MVEFHKSGVCILCPNNSRGSGLQLNVKNIILIFFGDRQSGKARNINLTDAESNLAQAEREELIYIREKITSICSEDINHESKLEQMSESRMTNYPLGYSSFSKMSF